MKKMIKNVLIFFLLTNSLYALQLNGDFYFYYSGKFEPSYQYTHLVDADAKIALKGSLDNNVQLLFETTYSSNTFDLSRAYLKGRFNNSIITIGKTYQNWGDALFLNSANLLFEEFINGKWLASYTYYLSPFSFIEGTIIPKQVFKETSYAIRLYSAFKLLKLESALAYNEQKFKNSVTLQGTLPINWSVTTSFALFSFDQFQKDLKLGLTVFHLFNFGLALRFEALLEELTQFSLHSSVAYRINERITLGLDSRFGETKFISSFATILLYQNFSLRSDVIYDFSDLLFKVGFNALF
jgi:hypothetical protein